MSLCIRIPLWIGFVTRPLLCRPTMFSPTFERRPWTPQICKHPRGQTTTKKLWTELIFATRSPICMKLSRINKTKIFTKYKNLTLNFLLLDFGERKETLHYLRRIFNVDFYFSIANLLAPLISESMNQWINESMNQKNCVRIFIEGF